MSVVEAVVPDTAMEVDEDWCWLATDGWEQPTEVGTRELTSSGFCRSKEILLGSEMKIMITTYNRFDHTCKESMWFSQSPSIC